MTIDIEGITVLKFNATWCGPCKMLAPVLEEVAQELTEVKFVNIDIEEQRKLTEEFAVMSVPTLVVLKDGKRVATHNGFAPKEAVLEFIKEAM